MQTVATRTFILTLIFLLSSYIYLTANSTIPQSITIKEAPTLMITLEEQKALNQLNELRIGAGLVPLTVNKNLQQAARNHAKYLIVNDKIGHYEDHKLSSYSGQYGSDRSIRTGYQTPLIIENVSSNSLGYEDSIDGLMAAIYHRFGFLDFHIDEIGIGVDQNLIQKDKTAFVYDMGSKSLVELCRNRKSASKIYNSNHIDKVCADPKQTATKEDFFEAVFAHKYRNKQVVIYPFNGQEDIPPAFYDELPDPLPNHSVSGFPISISFNEARVQSLRMISFRLFDQRQQEITDTLVYDHKCDPNQQLKKYEFALFPLKRLEWNSTYYAQAVYELDGIIRKTEWHFHTKRFSKPFHQVNDRQESYRIVENEPTIFYFPPRHRQDVLGDLQYPSLLDIDFIDKNTIKLVANGTASSQITLEVGEHELVLDIKSRN